MQFDACETETVDRISNMNVNPMLWETTHVRIARAYEVLGYEVP
jgi:hypothetical protein